VPRPPFPQPLALALGIALATLDLVASPSGASPEDETPGYTVHYQHYEAAVEADDLEAAVVHARRAYLAAARERGPDDEYTGVLAYNLGVVNYELVRYRDAIESLERAVAVYEEIYGEEHERVATPLAKLAAAHQALEEWEDAERLYVRTARILSDALGPENRKVGLVLAQLGRVADGLGEPKRMRSYGLRALAILGSESDSDPVAVANLHLTVARAELMLGDASQARRHTEIAVELYERGLGQSDPRVLEVYDFAADVYERVGKEYTARKYRRKARGSDDGD